MLPWSCILVVHRCPSRDLRHAEGTPARLTTVRCARLSVARTMAIRESQGTGGMLTAEMCDRARLARDVRFDGRFVTGVRTTRNYCRPICPVQPAHSTHVCFFPSAAAAERAGFRPCLRCRPETAPGTPVQQGSGTTGARGVTLINAGFFGAHTGDALA